MSNCHVQDLLSPFFDLFLEDSEEGQLREPSGCHQHFLACPRGSLVYSSSTKSQYHSLEIICQTTWILFNCRYTGLLLPHQQASDGSGGAFLMLAGGNYRDSLLAYLNQQSPVIDSTLLPLINSRGPFLAADHILFVYQLLSLFFCELTQFCELLEY